MINVSHFGRTSINMVCVRKIIALVHSGYLWLGDRILINDILIKTIIVLPYQGRDPDEEFVGKIQDKAVTVNMKNHMR